MSRSPWHSMVFQRRCPRADPRVLFRTLLHVLRVWRALTSLVRRWEHLVAGASASKVCTLRLSSGFALLCFPRIVHGGPSSPPGLVPEVIPCRRSARVCSEHLRVGRSWFVAMVWLSPASASGVHSRRSSVVATLRSCRRCGCVPRGQRALLDADMLELIDRSACLVEPVAVESCAPPPVLVLSPQQARPAPRPVAAREFPLREALWNVFCSLRAYSELLLSLHCDSCSWMIGTFLLLFTFQRDVSPCSMTYFCMFSILGHILRVGIQRLRNPQC